jgi:hypothetical protein
MITKNKYMIYAKQMWKKKIIMLTCVNMNMKKTWQGYGVKSFLRLVLKKLNVKNSIFIYTP